MTPLGPMISTCGCSSVGRAPACQAGGSRVRTPSSALRLLFNLLAVFGMFRGASRWKMVAPHANGKEACVVPGSSKIRPSIRGLVIARDGLVCQICFEAIRSKKDVTFDHILPKCKGGLTVASNLRVTCLPCNNARGDGSFSEEKFRKVREKIVRKLNAKAGVEVHRQKVAEFNKAVLGYTSRITNQHEHAVAACRFAAEQVKRMTFEEKLAVQKLDEERLERELIAGG
jgi:5-methylcytosine-specific restriction endonuclease McrA